MTLAELNSLIISSLTPSLGAAEAKATARLLLEDDLNVSPTVLLTRGDRTVEPETEARFRKYIDRIASGEPPQYVIGKARFMGMDFKVSRATLIPRPETAQLVDIVVDYAAQRHDLKILDVGTGSGCIAIALARAIPFSDVTAIDISDEALSIARQNADALRAKIDFVKADILNDGFKPSQDFDIVVSNPPYIAASERKDMERRVTDFEPAEALFVPDDDPLLFYRTIVDKIKAKAYFFEINPLFAHSLREMLINKGFDCELRADSFGKTRFAISKNM